MGVHLKPHLPAGTYTATYRVVSADGHIVSSGFNFSIGHPGAAGRPSPQLHRRLRHRARAPRSRSASPAGSSTPRSPWAWARSLFLLLVWLPALALARRRRRGVASSVAAHSLARLRRLVIGARSSGLVSAAAGVVLEAAERGGHLRLVGAHAADRARGAAHALRHGVGAGRAGVGADGLLAALFLSPRRERAPALRPAELGATGLALRSPLEPAARPDLRPARVPAARAGVRRARGHPAPDAGCCSRPTCSTCSA